MPPAALRATRFRVDRRLSGARGATHSLRGRACGEDHENRRGVLQSTGDNAALAAWYAKHLGLQLEDFGGAILRWPDDRADDRGVTVWHVAGRESKWFSPSDASFMINYRVDDLEQLLEQLRAGDVEIVKGPESHENGKFAWIMDPDGNKLELWEPKLYEARNQGT